ncbi:MAG: hypothetical protein RhofKO_19720 [Rhodothermales bacterium]
MEEAADMQHARRGDALSFAPPQAASKGGQRQLNSMRIIPMKGYFRMTLG